MCLTVIGKNDDVVRPWRVAARAVDARELLVELPQRLERVRTLEPRVVRDLVVAREGRVHRRAALHQVREDAEHDEVADDHAHRGSDERVDPAAMTARLHVAADRAQRRDPLQDDLPEEQDERAGDVVRVREERAVTRVRPFLHLHAADRQDQVVGLARKQVPATGAAVAKQPVTREAALDLGAVSRRRARHDGAALLLDPAEGRDVVVRAQQDPCLARAGLRREVGLPFQEAVGPVRKPARHRRRVPVAHRPLEHGLRETVDLEEDDSRDVRLDALSRASRDALDDADHVRVVVIRPGHDFERGGDRRDDERCDDPRPESAYFDRALRERVDDTEHDGVEKKEQEKRRRDRVREPNRRHEWGESRIEGTDQQRCQQRIPEVPDVEPREDSGCEKDACSADEERQEQPRGAQRRPHIGPEGPVAVRRGTVFGQRHGWTLTLARAKWPPYPMFPVTRVKRPRTPTVRR